MCEEQGSDLYKVLEVVELFQLPPLLLRAEDNSMQAVLYGPRSFADMTPEERVRAPGDRIEECGTSDCRH